MTAIAASSADRSPVTSPKAQAAANTAIAVSIAVRRPSDIQMLDDFPRQTSEEREMLDDFHQQTSEEEAPPIPEQPGDKDDDGFSDVSSAGTGKQTWPPKAPIMRFKNVMHFSDGYKSQDEVSALLIEHNKEEQKKKGLQPKTAAINDTTIGWMNIFFKTRVVSEHQLEVGFPVIAMTMLDAIYPAKVPWRLVDWAFQYKRAVFKNYAVLDKVWAEVNMEKARGFRAGDTRLRLEMMPSATLQEKLEFLKLMRNWFDARIHNAAPYDPLVRRAEIAKSCHQRGFTVDFPPWMDVEALDGTWLHNGSVIAKIAGLTITWNDATSDTLIRAAVNAFSYQQPDGQRKSARLHQGRLTWMDGTIWILKDDPENSRMVPMTAAQKVYAQRPEYQRLIHFLGSAEHQTM